MKYQDVKALLPNAEFVYVGVTDKELSKIVSQHYVTTFEEKQVLGTLEPVEALKGKELLPGSISFG